MMEQMYSFYTTCFPLRMANAGDYKQVGREMFIKYPSIRRYVKDEYN